MINSDIASEVINSFCDINVHDYVKSIPLFVIYNNPSDFPGKYVCRLYDAAQAIKFATVSNTLEDARKTIPPGEYLRIPAEKWDDPVIAEIWI